MDREVNLLISNFLRPFWTPFISSCFHKVRQLAAEKDCDSPPYAWLSFRGLGWYGAVEF